MNLRKSFFMSFDQAWCGNNQVRASLLSNVSEDNTKAKTIALFRFLLAFSLIAELLGYFLITLGFSFQRPIWFFLSGVILKMGGALVGAFFQNKAGTTLSLELQTYLKNLSTHTLEIKSFLSGKGCSESEINSIHTLPSEVYQCELNGYQRARILNIGAPIFCGLALLANGDMMTSFVVIILGLLSFPIGERFFRENTFRKESELRLGLAAQLLGYVDRVYKEHVWLTTKVNFLSQLPLLLFTLRFIWNGSSQLLSSFFGLTQGLAGLTGTLAFQKARVAAMKTTETTSHLINALSSPYLIVTPQRWKEHCQTYNTKKSISLPESKEGVRLIDFSPVVPFQEKEATSISCFIPSGTTCILKAPSGKGKSTFLAAVTHLIEHTGDIFFISKQKHINIHELSQERIHKQLFFFREENVENSSRIIDLFKEVSFLENKEFLQKSKSHFQSLLVDLAWKSPDNLLEQEIKNIGAHRPSVFPRQMLDFLKDLRDRQITSLQSLLTSAGGNLTSHPIFPERTFSTLSSGEKKRLVTLLPLEKCRHTDIQFVILDEPFTHLDKANLAYQMDTIKKIQDLPSPPSILLISHQLIDDIKKTLNCTEEISLAALHTSQHSP